MDIQSLLSILIQKNASDLHLVFGSPPLMRVDGELNPVPDTKILDEATIERLVLSVMSDQQKNVFLANKELDFSFGLGEAARFRVNAYNQKGTPAAAIRLIPNRIRTIEELNLPDICHQFATLKQGFVLVTGPTGHGKSTTLAAVIDEINQTRREHIVTIEDPIEYVYTHRKSLISQREMYGDTHSWKVALRSVLREDPNVVLVGEMRDFETISAALTVAETGHLVLASLHTNSAAQTIDRIVDTFPEYQQPQVRLQLSNTLEAVLSQRLLPSLEGGRVPAYEILLNSTAVQSSIRDGKTHLIDNIIQTSTGVGMITLEMSLAQLVKSGKLSREVAGHYALKPNELRRLLA